MIEKLDKYFERKISKLWDGHPVSLLGRQLGNGAPSRANSRYGQIWTDGYQITRVDQMGYGALIWVSGLPEKISPDTPCRFPGRSPLPRKLGRRYGVESDRFVDSTCLDLNWVDVGTDRTDPDPRICYNGSTQMGWVREAFARAGFPPPPDHEVIVDFNREGEMTIAYPFVDKVVWSYKGDMRRTLCEGKILGCKVGPTTASVWEVPGPFLILEEWGSCEGSVSTSRDSGMWDK